MLNIIDCDFENNKIKSVCATNIRTQKEDRTKSTPREPRKYNSLYNLPQGLNPLSHFPRRKVFSSTIIKL